MARFHTYLLSLSQGAAGKIWNIKARPKYSWRGKRLAGPGGEKQEEGGVVRREVGDGVDGKPARYHYGNPAFWLPG